MSASSIVNGGFGARGMSQTGQQATLADASPVFELNVWSREANRALTGQKLPLIAGTYLSA
jgi:hypothetical protein